MLCLGRLRWVKVLWIGVFGAVLVLAPDCLRTLDESRIPTAGRPDGGGGLPDGSAGAGQGGRAGTGGVGATGGENDGAPDAPVDAPLDAPAEAGFTPYDPAKHPIQALYCAPQPAQLVIAADDQNVYRIPRGVAPNDPTNELDATPLDGSTSGFQIAQHLAKPEAIAAPAGSLFLYIAAGDASGANVGSLLRVPRKASSSVSTITTDPIELAVGIFAASDGYAYASTQALVSGLTPAILRFGLAGNVTSAQTLYSASAGNETGGDITVSAGCAYWISSGAIWAVATNASATAVRKSPLVTPINDAVGLASDAQNLYYTRENGEVWQKPISSSCDASGAPERRIAGGYVGIGGVIAYGKTVAWAVKGDATSGFRGGGVFTTSVGGYDVVQIAPNKDENGNPVSVDQITSSPNDVVYSTASGCVLKVPK